MITDVKYLESQFSDELAEELDKSDEENSTNVDAVIAEIMNIEGAAFTNTFDIDKDLVNEGYAYIDNIQQGSLEESNIIKSIISVLKSKFTKANGRKNIYSSAINQKHTSYQPPKPLPEHIQKANEAFITQLYKETYQMASKIINKYPLAKGALGAIKSLNISGYTSDDYEDFVVYGDLKNLNIVWYDLWEHPDIISGKFSARGGDAPSLFNDDEFCDQFNRCSAELESEITKLNYGKCEYYGDWDDGPFCIVNVTGSDKYKFFIKNFINKNYPEIKFESYLTLNKQSSIGESYLINEAMLKSAKDIYHNKDKFKSGETNLCFITGLSGSGKSSMGTAMVKGAKNIEHYDMDDIVFNKQNHDMDYYKNYGDLVYKFFSGPGQKYFVTFKEIKSSLNTSEDKYRDEVTNAFVDFAISYARSHKNTKFIVEGVWLYRYVSPNKLKDYAVCIKGTSAATSMMRAAKRDNDYIGKFKKGTVWVGDEMKLNKYRSFYKDSMDENDSDSTGAIKESRTIFGSVDNMELMYMSCYEAYLYNTINNESRLTEALINECGLHESAIILEADLKQDIRNKWTVFLNFIDRMMDRFNMAMDKILYCKTKYLEDNKNTILGTPWRDDIPYEYEGDYDEAVERCMNTPCPVFNYERDAHSLRQDGYAEAIKVFMAGKGFKYNEDQNVKLECQFKDYFLAKDRGKKSGKLSDIKPQKLYDFCYNYTKMKNIIEEDNQHLKQSTNIIINAINKEMRERGEDPTKQSNTNSQTSTTGNGGSTNNNSGTNTSSNNSSSNSSTQQPTTVQHNSSLWISVHEADGEQQSPTGNASTQSSGDNNQSSGNKDDSASSGKTGLSIGNNSPAAEDRGTEDNKTNKTDTTQQDINNMLTKWRNLCRCLITAKLTAIQQISNDFMALITAHVNSVNSKPTNADNKQGNNQKQNNNQDNNVKVKQDQTNNQEENKEKK